MRRSTKYFLLAIISGFLTWAFCTTLIGYADVIYLTDGGPVDFSDTVALSSAIDDPSFTATYTWGEVTLRGFFWGGWGPLVLGGLAFMSVFVIERLRKPT